MKSTLERDTLASPYFEVATAVKDKPTEVSKPKLPRGVAQIVVIDAFGKPLADGEFAFHQDDVVEKGSLAADGRAAFSTIDPGARSCSKSRTASARSGPARSSTRTTRELIRRDLVRLGSRAR